MTDDNFDEVVRQIEQLAKWGETNRLSEQYWGTAAEGTIGGPYAWQVDFHAHGKDCPERAIIAGNRVGKTRTAGVEFAIHCTGLYPPWWTGRKWDRPVDTIAACATNELVRDIVQHELCGPVTSDGESRSPSGTGWIPKACIGELGFRQCGVPNVLDTVKVRHVSGGWSTISFKSFEQGDVKFQGVSRDLIWLDEEPPQEIFSESLARLIDKRGSVMLTRTPLFGLTGVIRHFMSGKPGVWYKNVTWDDAPHLDKVERERLLNSIPEHERKTRQQGVPMLGSGAVYAADQDTYTCDPFAVPAHFRQIQGIDFGIDHPGACAHIAYDADLDIAYVVDSYKQSGQTAVYHAAAIKKRGEWIPVAWPHDGMVRDKAGGEPLAAAYEAHGVNMLPLSARYDDEKGGAQSREPLTLDILERMKTGRFRVFKTCTGLLEELRMLHRKDGVIQPVLDDEESAVRYAMMMLRYAVPQPSRRARRQTVADGADHDPLSSWR